MLSEYGNSSTLRKIEKRKTKNKKTEATFSRHGFWEQIKYMIANLRQYTAYCLQITFQFY